MTEFTEAPPTSDYSRSARQHVLDEAAVAVLSDRNADYGNPEDNFNDIARLWDAYWQARKPGPFTRVDVSVMMVLTKIGRLVTSPCKADHWVDIAGYASCGYAAALADAADLGRGDNPTVVD